MATFLSIPMSISIHDHLTEGGNQQISSIDKGKVETFMIVLRRLTLLQLTCVAIELFLQLFILGVFEREIFSHVIGGWILMTFIFGMVLLALFIAVRPSSFFSNTKSYLFFHHGLIFAMTLGKLIYDFNNGFPNSQISGTAGIQLVLGVWILIFLLNIYISMASLIVMLYSIGIFICRVIYFSAKRHQSATDEFDSEVQDKQFDQIKS